MTIRELIFNSIKEFIFGKNNYENKYVFKVRYGRTPIEVPFYIPEIKYDGTFWYDDLSAYKSYLNDKNMLQLKKILGEHTFRNVVSSKKFLNKFLRINHINPRRLDIVCRNFNYELTACRKTYYNMNDNKNIKIPRITLTKEYMLYEYLVQRVLLINK